MAPGAAECPRCRCTKWMAIAPSPTAEATRFTEPLRTSPAAKTPGRLVSRVMQSSGPRLCHSLGAGAGLLASGAGEDEAAGVEGEHAGQPLGVGVGAGEDEQAPVPRGRRCPPVRLSTTSSASSVLVADAPR